MSIREDNSLVGGVRAGLTDGHRKLMLDINEALQKGDSDEQVEGDGCRESSDERCHSWEGASG